MAKPRGFFKRPPGPVGGLWSWRYLNWFKTLKMINSKRVRGYYENFPTTVPLGSDFPEIELTTTDGRTINTRQFLAKKHFVLVTGAIT